MRGDVRAGIEGNTALSGCCSKPPLSGHVALSMPTTSPDRAITHAGCNLMLNSGEWTKRCVERGLPICRCQGHGEVTRAGLTDGAGQFVSLDRIAFRGIVVRRQ